MEDKKTLNPMNEDALNEVAGGATNYDFYGNPINNGTNWAPAAPVIVPSAPVNNGLSCSIKNSNGATYVCPSCGSSRFSIVSADERNINLKCKDCRTRFTVANVQ